MSKKVVIIDYGLGNLFSIKQACEHVGYSVEISCDPKKILKADGLILPGVGAFGNAMESLSSKNLISPIFEFIRTGRPFMGICLGMQLLFTESEEYGKQNGLNLLNGTIVKFPDFNLTNYRVPQIQWNKIFPSTRNSWAETPFRSIKAGEYMYFVHSYFAQQIDDGIILSLTKYANIEYPSAVLKDNILGIQFHPEKSSYEGLKIYRNWLK